MAKGRLCVAGIGTEVGKTVVSAVLCEALGADYWKPVASGAEDGPTDGEILTGLLSNGRERVHPSRYIFARSLSPHVAAALEGAEIELAELKAPDVDRPLVVELAGGVYVPLSDHHTNLDLIKQLALPLVIVSRHYLGSINHTLLTLDVLRSKGCDVLGVVFNGDELPDTERIISQHGRIRVLGRVPHLQTVSNDSIRGAVAGISIDI